jgi:hypothetical protein
VSAGRISKLVAEAAEREQAPIPAHMQALTTETDGITFVAYVRAGQFGWLAQPVEDDFGLPPGAQQLYVRAV